MNNVEYGAQRMFTSGKLESQKEIISDNESDSGEIGTDAHYSESESYVILTNFKESGDTYTVFGTTYLDGSEDGSLIQYASKADDPFGLWWDGGDWEAVDPDRDNLTTNIDFGGSGDGPDIDIEEFDSSNGVAAKLNINNEAQVGYSTYVNIGADIVEESDNDHIVPVKWKYEHLTAASSILSTVNVSVGPAGLSFNTSDVKEQWFMDVTAGPGEANSEG